MLARQAGAAPAQAVMLARLVSTNPQPAHPIAVQTAQLDDTRVLLGLHRVTTAAMESFQTGAHTSQTRASLRVLTAQQEDTRQCAEPPNAMIAAPVSTLTILGQHLAIVAQQANILPLRKTPGVPIVRQDSMQVQRVAQRAFRAPQAKHLVPERMTNQIVSRVHVVCTMVRATVHGASTMFLK